MRQKRQSEVRLIQLKNDLGPPPDQQRRPYPKVYPKFQNPFDPSQTWEGRGKLPNVPPEKRAV